jgi:motility quorum-sensing regulator / GCU-specific mRNA interferase toxin
MEKSTPHYNLLDVKALIEAGKVKATASAFIGARDLGIYDLGGICIVLMSLATANFYKSMTTHLDHKIWQDVYHAKTANNQNVYLKLTVVDDLLVISFKEL